MNINIYVVITRSLFNIMKLVVIFGIKIYPNSAYISNMQKPYFIDRLSVAKFVATIKPNTFDGSNYKYWCEWFIL